VIDSGKTAGDPTCPLEGDEMQLILVISKGAEMKSKFLFEKRFFSPVHFPHCVFPHSTFLSRKVGRYL